MKLPRMATSSLLFLAWKSFQVKSLSLVSGAVAQSPAEIARQHHQATATAIVADFREFLSIPNVASNLTDMKDNAAFIQDYIGSRGFTSKVVSAGGAPYVVAERPGSDGVMDVGASQRMQARIEVYESDIGKVRLDQRVRLSSENGGFSDSLAGTVIQISPQVQQRAVLSTDPTGDADARVVEVLVALEPKDAERVSRLRGLKVIARFMP